MGFINEPKNNCHNCQYANLELMSWPCKPCIFRNRRTNVVDFPYWTPKNKHFIKAQGGNYEDY